MPTHKVLMLVGLGIFIVMAVLLRLGTTNLGLFVAYAVLAIAGLGIAAYGQKLRDRR